jgi:hypothetical protein
MSGLWIQSHQTLSDHPNKDKLAEALFLGTVPDDVADYAAVGILHYLWWWALDYAQDGDLSSFSDRQIAKACRYAGDPQTLVKGLTLAGFVTKERQIHDWHDYAGKLIAQRERSRARTAAARSRTVREPCADSTRIDGAREEKRREDQEHIVTRRGKDQEHPVTADAGFATFWAAYPRKVGKTATEKRWHRLTAKDRAGAGVAAGHLAAHVAEHDVELQYIPHPSTFIGPKGAWEDWQNGPPPGYGNGNGRNAHHAGAPPIVKRSVCPRCEADRTIDERGDDHCPVCDWSAP